MRRKYSSPAEARQIRVASTLECPSTSANCTTSRQTDLQIVGQYSDDGYTGTNFQHPGFRRMIADIEAGKVNCVIVKDLSRFGRDYINADQYLERWYPEHGVRFLVVNDHIDSERGPYRELEQIVLNDLNKIIASVGDLKILAGEAALKKKRRGLQVEHDRIQGNLDRVYHLKKCAYDDYRSGLLSQADYRCYKEDYDRQEEALSKQLAQLEQDRPEDIFARPWIASLLKRGWLSLAGRFSFVVNCAVLPKVRNHAWLVCYFLLCSHKMARRKEAVMPL